MISFAITFFVGFLYDFVGVWYGKSFIANRAAHAAHLSVLLGLLCLLGLGAAFNNWHDAVALLLGYWAGTYVATRYL